MQTSRGCPEAGKGMQTPQHLHEPKFFCQGVESEEGVEGLSSGSKETREDAYLSYDRTRYSGENPDHNSNNQSTPPPHPSGPRILLFRDLEQVVATVTDAATTTRTNLHLPLIRANASLYKNSLHRRRTDWTSSVRTSSFRWDK